MDKHWEENSIMAAGCSGPTGCIDWIFIQSFPGHLMKNPLQSVRFEMHLDFFNSYRRNYEKDTGTVTRNNDCGPRSSNGGWRQSSCFPDASKKD